MSASSTAQDRPSEKLWSRVERFPSGRCRIHVGRGALDHVDQLNPKSIRQRTRFAQACDLKEPGCYDEVLRFLEREAATNSTRYNPDHDDGCRLVFSSLDKFTPEPIDWLWERYIPAGAVTVLEGDPGVGKTLLLCDLAARVSRGFLAPDRNPAFDEPGHDPEPIPELVWWFAGSDHVEQAVVPRLLAAGADRSMLRIVEGVEDMKANNCRGVSFPTDFASLWKLRSVAPRLVVIDPLSAFCGGVHNHQAAQKALSELARFASTTGAAVVVVRSTNRLGSPSSDRSSSGPSLLADSRSNLLLASHPSDPARLVLAPTKSNLCARATALELSIIDSASPDHLASPERRRGEAHNHPHPASTERQRRESSLDSSPLAPHTSPLSSPLVSWLGRSSLTAADLLRSPPSSPAPRSALNPQNVEAWLNEKLSAGPLPAREISDQAFLDEIPPILLRRARISLGVIPSGRNGSTTWRLPEPPTAIQQPHDESWLAATRREARNDHPKDDHHPCASHAAPVVSPPPIPPSSEPRTPTGFESPAQGIAAQPRTLGSEPSTNTNPERVRSLEPTPPESPANRYADDHSAPESPTPSAPGDQP